MQEAKLADLRQRTVDPNAIPAVIPIIGTTVLNSLFWTELKKNLESGNIKFLISMSDRRENIENNGSYFKMTSEQFADDVAPFLQTDELINEAVNLKAEFRSDNLKLCEPRTGYKDRAVVLAYGNYVASLIENAWKKQENEEEYDWDNVELVW